MCFSLFCEVNSRNAGGEWCGGRDDFKAFRMNGTDTQEKWDQPPVIPEQTAIGNLHLSFEYNKTILKIKVWQVSDLLLPPPQTSSIESVYVRSYFIPDTVNKSSRRTELVRVEPAQKDGNISNSRQNSIQHIFSSSSFSFETPLIYSGVTQEIIAERSLQLEVCMTQKQTGKTFLMAMVHLPLRTAVRRPIREKYPLIPCMNHTTPNSMKVYSAKDIIMNGSSSISNKSPLTNRASFSGKSSEKVNLFAHRFSSLNLSDSDDEGVGGSLVIRSRSPTITPEKDSSSTDEEMDSSFRKTYARSVSSPSSPDSENNVQTRVKKKIIPNEIFSRSLSSENYDPSENGRVRRVSGKFTVVKVDEEPRGDHQPLPDESQGTDGTKGKDQACTKKKIIPNELLNVNCESDVTSGYKEQGNTNHPSIHISDLSNEIAQLNNESNNNDDTELSNVSFRLSLQASSDLVSDVASTPGSRPETPVWDFYDFSVEEAENKSAQSAENESASPADDASKALGTLQASILRLSRNPQVLDTCRVTGPVLPTVMLDDFELEDDSDSQPMDENQFI
ncbi:hypothetical protein BgiMline_028837 [Biomphalaria glabrata]|nr:tonsoku-like protein isoform X6 [Biomphalaria glabrata]